MVSFCKVFTEMKSVKWRNFVCCMTCIAHLVLRWSLLDSYMYERCWRPLWPFMANDACWKLSKISGMSHSGHIFFLFFLQNDSQYYYSLHLCISSELKTNTILIPPLMKPDLTFRETNRLTKAGHTDHKLWFVSILVQCFWCNIHVILVVTTQCSDSVQSFVVCYEALWLKDWNGVIRRIKFKKQVTPNSLALILFHIKKTLNVAF